MKCFRIKVSTWTSSFRYPNLISGMQPTLKVPPVSTVMGLLNACYGGYFKPSNMQLGYYFKYAAINTDLETIYQIAVNDKGIPQSKAKSNVIRREFLYDCNLYVYVNDPSIAEFFKEPYYPVLLGRSSDLATIDEIREVELCEVANATKVKGQVIPLSAGFCPGVMQALPMYFTDSFPRNNIGTQPFSVVSYDTHDYPSKLTAYRDCVDGEEIEIYFHTINLDS